MKNMNTSYLFAKHVASAVNTFNEFEKIRKLFIAFADGKYSFKDVAERKLVTEDLHKKAFKMYDTHEKALSDKTKCQLSSSQYQQLNEIINDLERRYRIGRKKFTRGLFFRSDR